MSLLLKCPKCKEYTLHEKCPKCGAAAESPQYKFKPKWSSKVLVASHDEENSFD